MKVKFLKDHQRHKAGEIADVIPEAANYYFRCKVAIEVQAEEKEEPKVPAKKTPSKKK